MKGLAATLPRVALIVAALLGLLAAAQAFALVHGERELKRQALAKGRRDAQRMAGTIGALLRTLEPEVRALAEDLSAGRVPDAALGDRLEQGLQRTPAAFRMGVNFAPFAKDPHKALVAPYVVREAGGMRRYQMGDTVNYATQNWFQGDMAAEGWQEPHVSRLSHQVVAGFSLFIRRPGEPQGTPLGFVRMDLSLGGIRQILADASQGQTGYNTLLAPKGTFLAHPRRDWVAEERTIFQVAQETGDAELWRCGELAARGEAGVVETLSYLGDQPVWVFSEPIPAAHWTLQAAVFKSEGLWRPVAKRRAIMALAATLMAMGICLGAWFLEIDTGDRRTLWRWQGLVSVLLGLGICLLWSLTQLYPDPATDQTVPILTQESLTSYLAARDHNALTQATRRQFRIPTGLFLETLRFDANGDVVATGYVWQRYPADFPKEENEGFILSNAETLEASELWRRHEAGGDLVQYRFKATLRENFDNTVNYPFDQAVIRVVLGPRELDSTVGLVPDLDGYHVLNPSSLPGLDAALVLPGWDKRRSYFAFLNPTYTTTFGTGDENAADQAPKISFQLILSRQFLHPFISALLPVIVVACLLFLLLLVVGSRSKHPTPPKTNVILPVSATLLFPVLYAQITLRNRLASSTLLYLEYFYFIMYAAILLVAAKAHSQFTDDTLERQPDHELAKLLYWPLLLGSFFVVSLIFLY